MGERSPRQIGRALADGQIHPFNERRVQCRRVLGVGERCFEPPRRAHARSSFDLNDTIVSSRLEHLAVENRWPKDATDDLLGELKSVGADQGKPRALHAVRDVAQKSERVAVASSVGHRRRPEPRPHLDGDDDPRRPRLTTWSSSTTNPASRLHVPAIARRCSRRSPQPEQSRTQADTFDSERHHRVETSSAMLEPVVRHALGRGERLAARDAPVATVFPGSRAVGTHGRRCSRHRCFHGPDRRD